MTTRRTDRQTRQRIERARRLREIADAVLYEGYLLYPYRHSAIKNRQRWTFGVVFPRAYSVAGGEVEPWTMRTECLVRGRPETALDVTARFLHLLTRRVEGTQAASVPEGDAEPEPVPRGAIGWAPDTWEEGMEREVPATGLRLADLLARPTRVPFVYPAARIVEREDGSAEGDGALVVREQQPLAGALSAAAEPVGAPHADVYKLTARIENTTALPGGIPERYAEALLSSCVSTHTILQVHAGAFISLLDPPDALREAAAGCHNERTYPVLAGDEGDTDALLSSPIILYDYPQIAPESAGALFDGTEIDEILTLRILALSDEEKAEMREGDERARAILERTESLTAEQLMKLHGVIRSLGPSGASGASEVLGGGGDK